MGFETPILLITFNRPSHTAEVLAAIKAQEPKILFIFRDGPRPNNAEDSLKCQAVIDLIRREVDWDCELRTCFESENLGCGRGPAKAITWFFENVEAGIILEDDCLPAHSFFPYCKQMIEAYSNNNDVWVISGYNPLGRWYPQKSSCFPSKIGSLFGGWATWQRAWRHFDYSASRWFTKEGKDKIRKFLNKEKYFDVYSKEFDTYFSKVRKDIWDFQWLFARLNHDGLCMVPSLNQIANTGFGKEATHTTTANPKMPRVYEMDFPLKLPEFKIRVMFDWMVFERYINPRPISLPLKIVLKAAKIITRTDQKYF